MTLANSISISRILLTFPLVYILNIFSVESQEMAYAVWGIILFIVFTDFLDGYVARKTDQITNFGKIIDVPARSLHLAFGMVLCFLVYPALRSKKKSKISILDFVLVFISLAVTLYIFFDYEGLVYRQGILAKIQFGSFVPQHMVLVTTLTTSSNLLVI